MSTRERRPDESRSGWFRRLYDEHKMTVGQIAKFTNSNYSFVYGVIDRHTNGELRRKEGSSKSDGMEMNDPAGGFTHFDREGRARMVDVSEKQDTFREAVARCEVVMRPETFRLIETGGVGKGDVLGVARLGGIMAAKRTGYLIPLAHPLNLTGVSVDFHLNPPQTVEVEARVHIVGKTGVEMEALTAAAVAALTVYDMCKAVDRGMTIQNLRLISKSGGKSGEYRRPE